MRQRTAAAVGTIRTRRDDGGGNGAPDGCGIATDGKIPRRRRRKVGSTARNAACAVRSRSRRRGRAAADTGALLLLRRRRPAGTHPPLCGVTISRVGGKSSRRAHTAAAAVVVVGPKSSVPARHAITRRACAYRAVKTLTPSARMIRTSQSVVANSPATVNDAFRTGVNRRFSVVSMCVFILLRRKKILNRLKIRFENKTVRQIRL